MKRAVVMIGVVLVSICSTGCASKFSKLGPYDLMSENQKDGDLLTCTLQELRAKFGNEVTKGRLGMDAPFAQFRISAGASEIKYDTYDFKTDLTLPEGHFRAVTDSLGEQVDVIQLQDPSEMRSIDDIKAKWGAPTGEGRRRFGHMYREWQFTKPGTSKKVYFYALTWTEGGSLVNEIIWSNSLQPWNKYDSVTLTPSDT